MSEPKTIRVLGSGGDYEDWPNPKHKGASELAPARCSAKDWPEDFSDENGNYQCQCIYCAGYFVGHKRRFMCKECANTPGSTVTSSPNESSSPTGGDK